MSLWPMCWSLKILAEKSTDLCQIRHFCNSMCLMMISQVNPSSPIDTWSNKWKARNFSPNNIYKNMMRQSEACFLFKWLRKCASRIRHKIFFWVAIHDIINTRGCSKVDPSRWKLMLDCYGMNLLKNLPCISSGTVPLLNLAGSLLPPNRHRGISFFDEVVFLHQALPKIVVGTL